MMHETGVEAARAALQGSYLKQLKLPAIAKVAAQLAREARQAGHSHEEFLLALLEAEIGQREVSRQKLRLAQARFPVLKTLASFQFEAVPSLNKATVLELARGGYIAERQNVILLGGTGAGKTHLVTALGVAHCQQGRRVRFIGASELANRLLEAHAEHRVTPVLASWQKFELVIVDELGFVPFSSTGAELLFEFFSAAYERQALAVTTNLPFADWTSVFGNDRLTAALLDRLTHRCHILELRTESFRLRQSLRQQTPRLAPAESLKPSPSAAIGAAADASN
jgi:DNA replication protein DnaC